MQTVPLGDAGHASGSATPTRASTSTIPRRAAEAASPDGTMSTVGDVGYVDDDGYLYLTDRKTFMIISGGVNIYPQETENLLVTHPKVADAAVFGVPNADLGEEVKAVVQPMPGFEPAPELERRTDRRSAASICPQKCPRPVDFDRRLPRLPTGKLYKRVLRDKYWGDTSRDRVVAADHDRPAHGTGFVQHVHSRVISSGTRLWFCDLCCGCAARCRRASVETNKNRPYDPTCPEQPTTCQVPPSPRRK